MVYYILGFFPLLDDISDDLHRGIENQGLWLEVCIAYQDYGDPRRAAQTFIACTSNKQQIYVRYLPTTHRP